MLILKDITYFFYIPFKKRKAQ